MQHGMLPKAVRDASLRLCRRNPRWSDKLLWVLKEARPEIPIVLDYGVDSRPRYDVSHPHPKLDDIVRSRTDVYADHLRRFVGLAPRLRAIPRTAAEGSPPSATWINPYQPPLDALALYGFLSTTDPKTYLEIGSGYSTRFARRAIDDGKLRSKIVSIDGEPRADIDAICDRVIRSPLEAVDLAIFDQLQAGDLLFIDSSHRCFMNSDVTVLFLEVLPNLPPGVLVQIHDIFIPYDYPMEWAERYYAEQYFLSVLLIAGSSKVVIELPNHFVTNDAALSAIPRPLWNELGMANDPTHGFAFWLRTS
jgi:predicted O-methyltransferase YrrM